MRTTSARYCSYLSATSTRVCTPASRDMAESLLPIRSNAAESSLRCSSRFFRPSSARLRCSSWYFITKAPAAVIMPSMAITVVTRRGLDSGSVSLLRSPPVKKAANMKKRAIAHIDQIVMFQNVCSDIFCIHNRIFDAHCFKGCWACDISTNSTSKTSAQASNVSAHISQAGDDSQQAIPPTIH